MNKLICLKYVLNACVKFLTDKCFGIRALANKPQANKVIFNVLPYNYCWIIVVFIFPYNVDCVNTTFIL